MHAIEKLDLNKACGSDGICSEHLKCASNVLVPLLAMCFTSFISHRFLSESMLSIVLVPVIKDTAGEISSKDNYLHIAFASVISKLVVVIMLDRNEMYINTQLGARGVQGYILPIVIYCCKNQDMCIRWGDAYSAKLKVTNGVRQGGYYPLTFSMYM